MRQIIDCDVHPTVPSLPVLLPFMDAYWQDQITMRGLKSFDLATYRPTLPITSRPDWRHEEGRAGLTVEALRDELLEPFGIGTAICNVVHGGSSLFNGYLGAAVSSATNDWLVKEWLDREPRLRASIVVPVQDPEAAAREIERLAGDSRFVQVLMPVGGDMPFGRRHYWPIYRAAAAHRLPVAIHPGGGGRYTPSYSGWHSFHIEEYYLQANFLQSQMLSLVYEGVFREIPELTVVMLESGVTWLPAFLVDADNKWMALRREVPWVTEAPSEIVKRHMRFSTQPFDAPASETARVLEMLGGDDLLLFSTDYPHWQFDGGDAFPPGLPAGLQDRIARANPSATYPRLNGASS